MASASFRYVLPLFLSLSLSGFAQISATPAPTAPGAPPTVKVEPQDSFTVVGLTVRTTNDKEAGGQGLIPKFWESVMDQDKLSQVPNRLSDDMVVVYSDYASDASGAYSYTLGVRVSSADKVADGFVARKIQAGKYAVIQSEQGPPQEVIPALWAKINQMTPAAAGRSARLPDGFRNLSRHRRLGQYPDDGSHWTEIDPGEPDRAAGLQLSHRRLRCTPVMWSRRRKSVNLLHMSSIQVQLPDGSLREVPAGTTPLAIAEGISPRLAQAAVVARIRPLRAAVPATAASEGGEASMYAAEDPHAERLVDLATPLQEDVAMQLITEKDPEALKVLRHSAAHVLATAVTELFPETKLGHGPATDAGFFYDFWRPTPFTPEDLKLIEGRMAEVVARNENVRPRIRAARGGPAAVQSRQRLHEGPLRGEVHPAGRRPSRSTATAASSISAAARMCPPPAA